MANDTNLGGFGETDTQTVESTSPFFTLSELCKWFQKAVEDFLIRTSFWLDKGFYDCLYPYLMNSYCIFMSFVIYCVHFYCEALCDFCLWKMLYIYLLKGWYSSKRWWQCVELMCSLVLWSLNIFSKSAVLEFSSSCFSFSCCCSSVRRKAMTAISVKAKNKTKKDKRFVVTPVSHLRSCLDRLWWKSIPSEHSAHHAGLSVSELIR